ncbi:MAG: FliM/FliN family flagellar motor switch protein [Rubellimicrobium sp.]|nr:FliM/FliN family flagellar motor switch protein [Rubellimicrobium sp.]
MTEGLASEGAAAGGAIPGQAVSRDAGLGASGRTGDGMVLRRMIRPHRTGTDDTEASSRAVRLAVVRAAEAQAGLVVTVSAITMEVVALEALLAGLDAGLMLVAVARQGQQGPVGFVAFDSEMRSGVIEAQTLGKPLARAASPRPPTRADHAMAEPLVGDILNGLRLEAGATPLEGLCDGTFPDGTLGGPREAGLRLAAGEYRVLRLSIDLGVGDRQGQMMIALPAPRPRESAGPSGQKGWRQQLERAVLGARGDLRAVLHRERMSLRQVETLRVGQVLALPGVTVSAVRLEALDGRTVASGRLGQIGGMKAVRIDFAGGPRAPGEIGLGQMVLAPASARSEVAGSTSVEGRGGRQAPGLPPPDEGHETAALPDRSEHVPEVTGGAGVATDHDLRPEGPEVSVQDPSGIPPEILAAIPGGLAVSRQGGRPGALDLSDEVDLGGPER